MKPDKIIEQILNYLGINAKKFSEALGYERPQLIYDIQKGKTTTISASLANKIESVFPQIDKAWLLTGEGEMLKGKEVSTHAEVNFTMVPLINIDSVGGMSHGNLITSGEQYAERLIPFTEARDGDVAIYQSGDSMNPGIPSGSILLIRNVPDWREYFGYGDVFVLWLKDDRRLTKQVKKYTPDPSNYVTCHSFNPDFGDEELPKKYIREVWKVIKVLADKGW